MRMNWFRVYHDARNDAKLRTLSDAQFRIWFNLLCLSSEQEDRGIIEDTSLDLLSVEVAGGDDSLLDTALKLLCKLRIIRMSRPESVTGVTGVTVEFIHFDDRQYDKPSDMPEATAERKRQQRERDRLKREQEQNERDNVSNKEGVTPCHALSHTEKRREEENIQEGGIPLIVGAQTAPAPTPIAKAKRDRSRETSIPDDFAPTPEILQDAKAKYPDMDVGAASTQWMNSMKANKSKYRYTDWNQAWWNGLDFADKHGMCRKGNGNGANYSGPGRVQIATPGSPPKQENRSPGLRELLENSRPTSKGA